MRNIIIILAIVVIWRFMSKTKVKGKSTSKDEREKMASVKNMSVAFKDPLSEMVSEMSKKDIKPNNESVSSETTGAKDASIKEIALVIQNQLPKEPKLVSPNSKDMTADNAPQPYYNNDAELVKEAVLVAKKNGNSAVSLEILNDTQTANFG